MRVVFLGKGGSGKTSLSGAFIEFATKKGPVLAIDADVNRHLPSFLEIERKRDVGDAYEEVASYLYGKREDIEQKHMVATTPPSRNSHFIRVEKDDPFLNRFCSKGEGTHLLVVGNYHEKDVGHTCYHGKLNVLEMIYHHLLDTEDEIVVADATAGIDNIGTSLYFCYDLSVFVVEPTIRSIEVCKEYLALAEQNEVAVAIVGNKIETPEDEQFIERELEGARILCHIPYTQELKAYEQGDLSAKERFSSMVVPQMEIIRNALAEEKRDWNAYYERLLKTHKVNSIEWWDSYYGEPISEQQDPTFTYQEVMEGKK